MNRYVDIGPVMNRCVAIGPEAKADGDTTLVIGAYGVDYLKVDFEKKTVELSDEDGFYIHVSFPEEPDIPAVPVVKIRGKQEDVYGLIVKAFKDFSKKFRESYEEDPTVAR